MNEDPAENIIGAESARVMQKAVMLIMKAVKLHGRFIEDRVLVEMFTREEFVELEQAMDNAELVMIARGISVSSEQREVIDTMRHIIAIGLAKDA